MPERECLGMWDIEPSFASVSYFVDNLIFFDKSDQSFENKIIQLPIKVILKVENNLLTFFSGMMSVPIPATTLNLFILCYFLHVCTVHLLHFNAEIFSVLIFFFNTEYIFFASKQVTV